jgi:hypothetical protein
MQGHPKIKQYFYPFYMEWTCAFSVTEFVVLKQLELTTFHCPQHQIFLLRTQKLQIRNQTIVQLLSKQDVHEQLTRQAETFKF